MRPIYAISLGSWQRHDQRPTHPWSLPRQAHEVVVDSQGLLVRSCLTVRQTHDEQIVDTLLDQLRTIMLLDNAYDAVASVN